MTLKVALIGCGRIASYFHAPILGRHGEAALTALVDVSPDAREACGRAAPGALRFRDIDTALRLTPLDAAVICLPPAAHAAAAIRCLRAGLHVYVEKPLALGLAEADAMIAAQAAAGRVGMVGFNFRFHPLVEDARARIARGELGEIVAVRGLFTSERRVLPGWKGRAGEGGGAIADLATHWFDLIPHLTGAALDPDSLRAHERRGAAGGAAAVILTLATGAPVEILVSQTSGLSARRLELLGEKGHLTIDLTDAQPRALERPAGRLARVARLTDRLRALHPRELLHAPGREPSFARALGAFVAAALGRDVEIPDFEAGRRALALAVAAETQASAPSRDEAA